MCMELKGNPEMGLLMVKLASWPEIQSTESSEEFLRKLEDQSYSKEFMGEYESYLKHFGCRGIREIDVATPRTREDQGGLFRTLKAINVEKTRLMVSASAGRRRIESFLLWLKNWAGRSNLCITPTSYRASWDTGSTPNTCSW